MNWMMRLMVNKRKEFAVFVAAYTCCYRDYTMIQSEVAMQVAMVKCYTKITKSLIGLKN